VPRRIGAPAGVHRGQEQSVSLALPCVWGTWGSNLARKCHFFRFLCDLLLCFSSWDLGRYFSQCISFKNLLELLWSSFSCLRNSMWCLDL